MPSQSTTSTIASTCALYKSHPLYFFRRLIIITDLIGVPLTLLATTADEYSFGVWLFGAFTLIASGLLALADLLIWAHKKHKEDVALFERVRRLCRSCSGPIDGGEDSGIAVDATTTSQGCASIDANNIVRKDDGDDDKSKWPVRWIMITDFLLTGTLFCALLSEMMVVSEGGYSYGMSPAKLEACYATVPMGFAFVLHARCWWRQFRAREREAWIMGLGLRIGTVSRVKDIEAGVESIDRCHAFCHRQDFGSSCEGHGTCGFKTANEIQLALKKRKGLTNSVRDTVKELNREAVKAMTSKAWLPGKYSTGERQSLLTHDGFPRNGYTDMANDSNQRCHCSHFHACRSFGRGWKPVAHVHGHGHSHVDHTSNDNIHDNVNDAQKVEPIGIDRTTAYLTPSDSGVTSASSSTASSSSRNNQSRVDEDQKEIRNDTDIEDEDVAAISTLLSQNDNSLSAIDRDDNKNDDDDDDADIMVVKKAKKAKAKPQKQRKGKGREIEFEE